MKNIIVAAVMIVLVAVSSEIKSVESSAADCLDACSTCCVQPDGEAGMYVIPGKKGAACQAVVGPGGHFSTIQSAINSVLSDNENWVCIFIKAGIYREKVKIPHDKPYIILKGEGKRQTNITWDDHDSLAQSPTFSSLADNIVVSDLTIVNSYGNGRNPRVPAVAARVAGDKTSFRRCRFVGLQNTLWDVQGRHYFNHCTIEGAVDFIFGNGQSIYENCVIRFVGRGLEAGHAGFITAQGRQSPNDSSGFVLKESLVIGSGSAYFGRPWGNFARVFFYNSNLTNVIHPQGWTAWNVTGRENQLTFAEQGSYGAGSSTSDRVSWEKKLSLSEMKQLTSITFIDKEGWLKKQPS